MLSDPRFRLFTFALWLVAPFLCCVMPRFARKNFQPEKWFKSMLFWHLT